MLIKDIFETRIEEKIEPVIKVGERQDERKLAAEIGNYVVTPIIERYLDDFLEHYTDTFRKSSSEVGVWISGYFGSGKSHLAKIAALLIENHLLDGIAASKRFEARIPSQTQHRDSILRSLACLSQCDTQVQAFNLNSLADSKSTPLPRLLLSQFYLSKGYGGNFIYARVIEAELDKLGKLGALHTAAERLTKKTWKDIQSNLGFYSKPLYQAVCEVAPEVFSTPDEVAQALKNAEKGELYNVQFLVRTILDDLAVRQKALSKPCRLVLVLDESGQWIEDDAGRLAQLQALVEEAATQGQGKLWMVVTTHEDMGSIYQNARALKGDMKKIEGRFRFKFNLTTENIELVLEDRLFKKKLAGKSEVVRVYNHNPGVLRDLGQLANCNQKLPECTEDRFTSFYPFFPYQIHLIPEIVKSLRSAGGRGEQLSGSTRTLLAITQDILRIGRRNYLNVAVGEVVSFDELYHNLAGEGEVPADARRELGRIQEIVPAASLLTQRVAEILFLIREIAYIPRTIDNLARLMVEHSSEDLTTVRNRIEPELQRLINAKLVAKLGDEYEFLTGERRTFEEEVAEESSGIKWQDLEAGLAKFASTDVLGFERVPFKGKEFPVRILFDGSLISKEGYVDIKVSSPLSALAGTKVSDLEDLSLLPDEQFAIFVLCDRIPGFDNQLKYYLAMRRVVDRWKGDPHKSAEAHKLASEREAKDLEKLRNEVLVDIRDGLKRAQTIFRGSSRSVSSKPGQAPGEALRSELASFWPTLYPKFEKVPVRILQEQHAILDVLKESKNLSADVRELKLFDPSGQLDPQWPLLDTIRIFLSTRQNRKERTLGDHLLEEFVKPPYGWDEGAVRVGVAALVRSGAVKVLINKRPFTNPTDPELQDTLRVARNFDKAELMLEESSIDANVLMEVRALLIKLTGKRKIDETPAALSAEMEVFGKGLMELAKNSNLFAEAAGLPLSSGFRDGKEAFEKILALSNPIHRANEIHAMKDHLEAYHGAIRAMDTFVAKWSKAFTEMRKFVSDLLSVEHHLPARNSCHSMLENWKTAYQSASITTENIWKNLQNTKAAANLELDKLLLAWKEEACKQVETTLQQLPRELEANGLPAEEFQEKLALPLKEFLSQLETESEVVRIAALPERARNLVTDTRSAIADLVEASEEKRDGEGSVGPGPGPEPGPQPTGPKRKPTKRIRVVEVADSIRIRNEPQWNLVRDRLDEAVRQELADGNEVILE